MPNRRGMTDWYSPTLLVQTGIRVAISTVFGEMADRREAIAAANALAGQPFDDSFDYSEREGKDGLWIDFVADTGDGWNSTFAIAQLLTESALKPAGSEPLPRGRILILGGDQVYPTASREEYDDRFLYPFEEARRRAGASGADPLNQDLYAIPGNHDWYDGLAAFFNLFCRRRIAPVGAVGVGRDGKKIAGRPTWQTRSYFALKLPHGWWLWGTDSQLKGYIDQPQIDFFQYVASHWMENGSKLILCTGAPSWAYVDPKHPEKEFTTFSYLERLAEIARVPFTAEEEKEGRRIEEQPMKGHRLKLVLTGDSHYYSRHVEPRADEVAPVQYITCGGGGAFLHPTHQLRDVSFSWDYPPPGGSGDRKTRGYQRHFRIADKQDEAGGKALFPDAETSRGLTRRNMSFALAHWKMALVFLAGYLVFNWMLNLNARVDGHLSLVHAVTGGTAISAIWRYVWTALGSPWPAMLFALAVGGYYYFADSPHNKARRLTIGLAHAVVQTTAAAVVTALLLWWVGSTFALGAESASTSLVAGALIMAATAVAALLSATILGLYLWFCLNLFGMHWNEAFSSLAIADYKSFLRLRIRQDGKLEVYPIGLEKTPRDDVSPKDAVHLIEGPVVIS